MNIKVRDLFGRILETYLELPHKLKPIFDRLKKYEHSVTKLYKLDPTLLYDLTSDVIEQYKEKNESIMQELRASEERFFECKHFIARL